MGNFAKNLNLGNRVCPPPPGIDNENTRVGDFFDFLKKSKKSDLFDLNQILLI